MIKFPFIQVQHDVLINVDSEWDLQQTLDICKHHFPEPKQARVLLRMNLNIDPVGGLEFDLPERS